MLLFQYIYKTKLSIQHRFLHHTELNTTTSKKPSALLCHGLLCHIKARKSHQSFPTGLATEVIKHKDRVWLELFVRIRKSRGVTNKPTLLVLVTYSLLDRSSEYSHCSHQAHTGNPGRNLKFPSCLYCKASLACGPRHRAASAQDCE